MFKFFSIRLSWLITYLIPFSIVNLLVSITFFATSFFKSIELTCFFFILIELFSISTLLFGMIMSTFFTKSRSAGAGASLVFSFLSLLYFPIFIGRTVGKDVPLAAQWILSLIFPCAFSLGVDQVSGVYCKRKNIFEILSLNYEKEVFLRIFQIYSSYIVFLNFFFNFIYKGCIYTNNSWLNF